MRVYLLFLAFLCPLFFVFVYAVPFLATKKVRLDMALERSEQILYAIERLYPDEKFRDEILRRQDILSRLREYEHHHKRNALTKEELSFVLFPAKLISYNQDFWMSFGRNP
jgi:uncharacterized protein (DUF58 family)